MLKNNWGLRKAEEALRPRPEKLRTLLIIHDGQPVYKRQAGQRPRAIAGQAAPTGADRDHDDWHLPGYRPG